ncbi:hypothetical protein [Tatumella sp. OPLPL6]|uniref:hypothetical protein n=1 Tax=Tatumella sp. OPLPL6 TaxID=1928657 RepID=UPI000C198BDE|nr:hypothetical protein [Tatumella sp. OPLPL6]PIJ43313.1 hypothetical protein BOM24_09095 [Tatumella sp. OPLPL6]
MRKPFTPGQGKMSEEQFLSSGSADNTLPRSKPKTESYKAYSFTLPPASMDSIKRAQLRLMQLGGDNANRSDVVRAALMLLDDTSDKELEALITKAKA